MVLTLLDLVEVGYTSSSEDVGVEGQEQAHAPFREGDSFRRVKGCCERRLVVVRGWDDLCNEAFRWVAVLGGVLNFPLVVHTFPVLDFAIIAPTCHELPGVRQHFSNRLQLTLRTAS